MLKAAPLLLAAFLFCPTLSVADFVAGAVIGGTWSSASWGDYNNDGYVDVGSGGALWRNDDGTNFTSIANLGYGVMGDYNNDGYLDHYSPASGLSRNNSGTSWTLGIQYPPRPKDTTETYGHQTRGVCFADLNGDGFIDIYVGGYEIWSPSADFPDVILMNQGGTNFVTGWTQTSVYRARGVTACDFDEDNDMDIYVSNYRLQPNLLWQNNGSGTFTDVAATYGVAGVLQDGWSYGHTIGSAWGDFDNDGHFDLFVGNFAHSAYYQDRARLYSNDGPPSYHFTERWVLDGADYQESYASPALGDYDNDGDLDLYFTTVYGGDYPRLYRNDGSWVFTDVTAAQGLSGLGSTYQASWADVDNDGDLDLATAGVVYVNQGNANHWIKVRLEGDGVTVNSAAIGAQVRIDVNGGTLVRQVEAGTGEGIENQNDPTLHFGLGSHSGSVTLQVTWPNGATQTVSNVSVDSLVEVGMGITVSNGSGASNITHNSAILNGALGLTQGTADACIYWGAADGGKTTNWQNSVWINGRANGTFSTPVSGLTASTRYYYQCYATNAYDSAWADSDEKFTTARTLPFEETFEDCRFGSLDAQKGWTATPPASVLLYAAGGQGGSTWACSFVSTGRVEHAFSGGGRTNIVWTDLYVQSGTNVISLEFSADLSAKVISVESEEYAGAATICFISELRQVIVLDGSSQRILANPPTIPESNWSRITLRANYSDKKWDLWFNGTNVARNLAFYDTNAVACTRFALLSGGDAGGAALLDNVTIATTRPPDIPFIDDDEDGLDDDWENFYFGSTDATAGTAGEDWDGDGLTDMEEFLAGTDPKDADSVLMISNAQPEIGTDFVLEWHSASNMYYSLAETTNLNAGWTITASNIPASPPLNQHTVTVDTATIYYRIQID